MADARLKKTRRPALRLIDCTQQPEPVTVAALKGLLRSALTGEITGVVLAYRTRERVDNVVVTGTYADDPARAIGAAMRISWRLSEAQEVDDGHGS